MCAIRAFAAQTLTFILRLTALVANYGHQRCVIVLFFFLGKTKALPFQHAGETLFTFIGKNFCLRMIIHRFI